MTELQLYTILAALFLIVTVANEAQFTFRLLKRISRFDIQLVSFLTAVLVLLLAAAWPGLISGDDFFLIRSLTFTSEIAAFSGGLYSGLMNLLLYCKVECYFLNSLQIFLYVSLFIKALYQINCLIDIPERRRTKLAKFITFLFFFSPLAISFTLFQNRDVLFSILFCHIVFYLIISVKNISSEFSVRKNLIYFLTLCLFALNLRQDALLNLVTVPFLLYALRLISLRETWIKTLFYLVFSLVIASSSLSSNLNTEIYRVTAFINPLSYIINKNGLSSLAPDEIIKIEKVFRTDYLLKYYSPLEIDPFHKGGSNMSATREDYDVFFQTCYAIFNRHKLDYLTNRLNVFAHGTNLLNTNYLTGDAFNTVAKRFQLDEKYFLAPYRDVIIDLTLGVTHHIAVASDFLRTIFFSLAPHFLIFLFLLFNFKRLYSELVLATWVFLRLPILFFLEPASIFKYYYAIYFCFIFLAIQIFLSHKAKKNPL